MERITCGNIPSLAKSLAELHQINQPRDSRAVLLAGEEERRIRSHSEGLLAKSEVFEIHDVACLSTA